MLPLTRRPGGVQAYKMIIAPGQRQRDMQVHEGYEWMYVLNGKLRLLLGTLDIALRPGEVAEFDTHTQLVRQRRPVPGRSPGPGRPAGRAPAREGPPAPAACARTGRDR